MKRFFILFNKISLFFSPKTVYEISIVCKSKDVNSVLESIETFFDDYIIVSIEEDNNAEVPKISIDFKTTNNPNYIIVLVVLLIFLGHMTWMSKIM